MINKEIALVAQISLKTNTYYVCDRDYVMLDGITYDNVILSWSDLSYFGNIGNGESQIGDIKVTLNNGEIIHSGGYKFSAIDIWNNYTMTIKRWESGVHMRFIDCDNYTRGIIKDFKISDDKISFTVDTQNTKDSILIPRILGEDQSALTDAESKTTFRIKRNYPNQICPNNYSIFNIGEYVKCISQEGYIQYNVIKEKTMWGSLCWMTLQEDLTPYWKWSNLPVNIIEKAFRYIPKNYVNRTIPIQIGDLSDSANGVFGKTITIDEKMGEQSISLDTINLIANNNIGVWDKGVSRYYIAKSEDYNTGSDNKNILFTFDSTAITTTYLDDTPGIASVYVDDTSKLQYIDLLHAIDNNIDMITTNIIGIDKELLLLLSLPDNTNSNKILWVERGYADTEVESHDIGSKVYMITNYGQRGILQFTERFDPISVGNLWDSHGYGRAQYTLFSSGIINSMQNMILDNDDSTVISFNSQQHSPRFFLYWDLLFKKPDIECIIKGNYFGIDGDLFHTYNAGSMWFTFELGLYNINPQPYFRDPGFLNPSGGYPYERTETIFYSYIDCGEAAGNFPLFQFHSIKREKFIFESPTIYYFYKPNFADKRTGAYLPDESSPFKIGSLSDIGKNWRMYLELGADPGEDFDFTFHIQRIGIWVDFIVQYTLYNQPIVSALQGRKITADANAVVGGVATIGNLCENIVEVLALLLTEELGYATSDFTENWPNVELYYIDCIKFDIDSPSIPIPKTAFSYGLEDEQKKGWEFCSWLASHFNLQIIKDCDGKIDIINLHEIYKNTPVGYEIKIEDIIFQPESGTKEISIMQTGTDLIYNDIIIKWKRNNSTNEYQEVLKLQDSYILAKSSITLTQARVDYYNGNKRSLVIESPFIYSKTDAQRLAEWKADDQAEVHFFIEFNLDFDHYSDKNSLSVQYKPGDIIYLTGEHGGIIFDIFKKFYIQNIILVDSGRKITIQAKSIDPVASWSLS